MVNNSGLTMVSGQWYGWQQLPGYAMTPYFSPIKVEDVTPLKTGQGGLRLRFFNAFYAGGVRDFEKTLRVLRRHPEYIVCDIIDDHEGQIAIVTDCTPEFLLKHSNPAITESLRELLLGDDPQEILDQEYQLT